MNKGLHLTLMIGSVKAEPVPQSVIEALTDVQVTSAATSQSGFQLKFTLGKRSAVAQQLLPSGYFDPRRRVIIAVTVNGTTHVLMDGVITKQDVSPSDEAGASTLTITGLDLSALMDFIDLTGIPYPALMPAAIVGLILAKYAVFGVVPLPIPNIIPLVVTPLEKWNTQQGTDLAYISALGSRVGHVFYIDPGPSPGISTAYWGPEIRYGSPQPAVSINMDSGGNVDSLTFSYDGLTREQLLISILEKNTKIPIPVPIPEVTLLKPTLARDTAKTLRTRQLGNVAKFGIAEAAQLALAVLAGSSDAVTASGQLNVLRYGHVLKPRQIVAARGGGDYYNGLYYVKSVTHNIKRGQYTQSFSLARGGVGSTIQRVTA
jgi:hypothetical protein